MNINSSKKNYRKGVLAIIVDQQDQFLIVQLQSYYKTDWNFVGGGAEESETPEENLRRELFEELGITNTDYEIISKSPKPQQYDFPEPVLKQNGVLYHGQVKEQFLVRFKGNKNKIILQEEEIREHKWVSFSELKNHLNFPGQYDNALQTLKAIYPSLI